EYSRMPLEAPPLSNAQIATLTQWIQQGAPWPDGVDLAQLEDRLDHWSFRPVADPNVPRVRATHWPKNPLDHFVLARLEQEALTPAPAADPVTWLRRVTLDL